MKNRFLFFAYRDWAINIFNRACRLNGEFFLCSDKTLCNEDYINKIDPDIIFFYGWSWIVSNEIIKKYKCLCLHPSPLPRYRGGSPIQNQIIEGEEVSAVTIFKMTESLDAGPIYYQEPFSLNGTLSDILKCIEFEGYNGTKKIIENKISTAGEQNHRRAIYCKRRTPEESEIKPEDFEKYDAMYFFNKIRSLQDPYPNPYIKCKKGRLIIKDAIYEQDV